MERLLVIVPVYNASVYIEECLRSLFAQSFQDFYVICVDDGSRDDSLDKLESFRLNHSHMAVIHTDNFGPSHARNIALNAYLSKGFEFVAFLDADDMLEPSYLQSMIDAQAASKADIVCSSFQFFKNGRKTPFSLMGSEARLLSGFEATKELLADHSIQSHSHCKLYKAILWDNVRFPEHIVAMEDQGTVFKAFYRASSVLVDPFIKGYLYRQTGNSVCSSPITNKKVLDSINGYLIACQFDYSGIADSLRKELVSTAKQSLAACYLMMYPRFNKRTATAEELYCFANLRRYVFREKIVQRYHPGEKRERLKRMCYLWIRPSYRLLYNAFKKK